nr:helix-turn-helix domain-containing protein [Bradyrhizobium lablabi]
MQSAGKRDIGIAELAAAAGLSGRALQRQFRAFLGKTPLEALHDVRFEDARRQLLRAAPGTKVMDVAARCGIAHFGRFSIEYRRRYGETPSQTLKRQATFFNTISSRLLPPIHDERPRLTIGPIETVDGHGEVARDIEGELSTALLRAGVAVCSHTGSTRYHLSGTIRQTLGQARLIFRLIDRETGRHLWAHRAEAPLGVAAFDEQLATRIAGALYPSLRSAEIDHARDKPDSELNARDLALRAMPGVLSLDAEGNARALALLNRAMELDPDHALSAALAAWAYGQRSIYFFVSDPAERARAVELVRRALTLRGDPTVLAIAGSALSVLHEIDAAEQVIGKALATGASLSWVWNRGGWIDAYRGNDESAIEKCTIALELAPDDSLAFNAMVGIGAAHFNAGRYQESARWQARALAEHPSSAWIHRTLCPAYALAGEREMAERSLRALRQAHPDLTLSKVMADFPPLTDSYRARVFEALEGLGLPS